MAEAVKRAVLSHKFSQSPVKEVDLAALPQHLYQRLLGSHLTKWGLLDKAFLKQKFTRDTIEALCEYADRLNAGRAEFPVPVLIERGVLTKSDFQHRIIAPHNVNIALLERILFTGGALSRRISFLIDHKILTRESLWQFFVDKRSSRISTTLFDLGTNIESLVQSGVISPARMNIVSKGLDAVEGEALWRDITGQSTKSRRYPVDLTVHPVVVKMRGQEHVNELSKQIRAVLDREPPQALMYSFKRVFDAYLVQTPLYKKLKNYDAVGHIKREAARMANVQLVNTYQIAELRRRHTTSFTPAPNLNQRYLDIYARYDVHGSMDPLQLAIIARTAWWYIMNGRSKLFTGVRILPYKTSNSSREYEIPWVALAACPGAKVLEVRDKGFIDSNVGANRMYLTHSSAYDSSETKSIPIVGLGTYNNNNKLPVGSDPFVVLAADFDKKDEYRRKFSSEKNGKEYSDTAGNIPALINETLRAIIECEDAEINRSKKSGKRAL
jgi:hypothetical protein